MQSRSYVIQESVKKLRQIEHRYRNKPEEIRLKALRLLKENPDLKLVDVAQLLGRTERTLQRWYQAYRQGGLKKLIQVQKGGGKKPIKIGEEGLKELSRKLKEGSFSGLREIQSFLNRRYGVNYSISQVWYLVRLKLKAELKPSRSKKKRHN